MTIYQNTERTILGAGCVYPRDPELTGVNNNVLVVGGTGSGKTKSIAEPYLLHTTDTNLIVSVTKRRLADTYIPLLRSRGYTVWDMNFCTPEAGNCSFDPVYGRETPDEWHELAEDITYSAQGDAANKIDPYWYDAAASLLTAVIGLTYADVTSPALHGQFSHPVRPGEIAGRESRPSRPFTMADVLDITGRLNFTRDQCGYVGLLQKKLDSLEPEKSCLKYWNAFPLDSEKTASCVTSIMNTVINAMFRSDARRIGSAYPQFDAAELTKPRTALFITTSAVNPVMNRLTHLFYGAIFRRLFELGETMPDGTLPYPVHFIADDFATGCPVPHFDEYISIFREKGISVSLLIQSESQLDRLYGTSATTTIINNCDSYVYLGGMDILTARNVGIRLNKPLDAVLQMPVGTEYLFRRGQKPIITGRYDVYHDNEYLRLAAVQEHAAQSGTPGGCLSARTTEEYPAATV